MVVPYSKNQAALPMQTFEDLKEPAGTWNDWLKSKSTRKAELDGSPWNQNMGMQSPSSAFDVNARSGGTLSRPGSALRALRERQRRQAADNGGICANGSIFEVLSPPLPTNGSREGMSWCP